MKYRIKQIGDKFYPQEKVLFCWWCNFDGIQKYTLYFESFENANKFLINEKNKKTVIYHNIKENDRSKI